MPVNDTIRVVEYNDIRAKIDSVYGPGSGTFGYGQNLRSTPVTTSNRITITEWGNLRFDIINAYRHIFGSNPTIVSPAAGDTVRYDTDFAPSSSMANESPVTQFDTWCNIIIANSFTVHPSQSATQSVGSGSTTWPGVYGDFWTSNIRCTITATWTNAAQARYFFNSGGEIRIAASRSGGSATQQNTAWTSILSSSGTRAFGGNLPGTGTSPLNGTNFYRCTDAFQQWFTASGSTPYGGNSYSIYARTPGVSDNSTGTANSIEFLLDFIDTYVDPGNSLYDVPDTIDAVDGTFNVAISTLFATGVLEPPGAGNFTVQQPTVTVSAIAPV